MKIKSICIIILVLISATFPEYVSSYPVDGFLHTGIRRLERLKRIVDGKMPGQRPVSGALKLMSTVRLSLESEPGMIIPKPDPALQREIDTLFPNRDESYSMAVLDISPGRPHRYAGRQEDRSFSPGSVGKLAIVTGLFTELKLRFPLDPEKRRELLKTRIVRADRFSQTDSHDVPFFNPDTGDYASRPVHVEDAFSLYEWTDHMLSASANSAASMVWKETMLLRKFGDAYPPTREQEQEFFEKTPKSVLKELAMDIVNTPLRELGISQDEFRLGSFFTSGGKRIVPGEGGSRATPYGLLKYLVALEKGILVDAWSSLEIKRLMYMTARRIRYASSPALADAAVYFKSGSLYRCQPEPGFKCVKYMGNVENVMNSVAIVEHPGGRTYLVALMSNILRKNSAVEHQTLATFIDRILAK